MRIARVADVGLLAFERGYLGLAQALTALDQLVVNFPGVPVDLVDRSRDD